MFYTIIMSLTFVPFIFNSGFYFHKQRKDEFQDNIRNHILINPILRGYFYEYLVRNKEDAYLNFFDDYGYFKKIVARCPNKQVIEYIERMKTIYVTQPASPFYLRLPDDVMSRIELVQSLNITLFDGIFDYVDNRIRTDFCMRFTENQEDLSKANQIMNWLEDLSGLPYNLKKAMISKLYTAKIVDHNVLQIDGLNGLHRNPFTGSVAFAPEEIKIIFDDKQKNDSNVMSETFNTVFDGRNGVYMAMSQMTNAINNPFTSGMSVGMFTNDFATLSNNVIANSNFSEEDE